MRTFNVRFLFVLGFAPVFWLLGSSDDDKVEAVLNGWDHRLIAFVVSSEAEAVLMEEIIEANFDQIADRDLLFVNLGNIEIDADHSLAIGLAEKEIWRSFWGLDLRESKFILIGKDGGVKAVQRSRLQLGQFFDLIDTMPLRIAEMRTRDSQMNSL